MSLAISQQLQQSLAENQQWLRGLARALVGEAEADDLVQDALERALLHPPATDRPIRPWLRTTMSNLSKMRWRSGSRRKEREEQSASITPSSASDASSGLHRLQTQERLVKAVLSLAEPYQQAVILRYVDGLSSAEIGRRLDLPGGTVRSQLKRGLETLRTQLDEQEERSTWTLGLVPFLGVPTLLSEQLATSTKGTSMNIGNTLIVTAALAGAGGVAAYAYSGSDAPDNPQTSVPLTKIAEVDLQEPLEPETTAASESDGADNEKKRGMRLRKKRARANLVQAITQARVGTDPLKTKTYDFTGRSIWPSAVATSPNEKEIPFGISHLRRQMDEATPLFAECYQLGLAENPELSATFTLDYVVEAQEGVGGYVREATISSKEKESETLVECLRETVLSLNFLPPDKSDSIRIVYPLTFVPSAPISE